MFNITNKKYFYTACGLILLIIIAVSGYYINQRQKNSKLRLEGQNQIGREFVQGDPNAQTPNPATTTPNTNITKKLSYGEAIKAYPYRYQFVNCSANPGTMSVKVNSYVMLDNRDKVAHTIKANGQTFKIAALDYQILRPRIEGDTFITCDGGGSGKINIEK